MMNKLVKTEYNSKTIQAFSLSSLFTLPGCTCSACSCKQGNESSDALGGTDYASGSPK